jgi:UDP-hydrolysing UDP-N-acetyl-D-glucosamine 2-epimerase
MTRFVCMPVIDRANWGRLEPVARAIRECPDLMLHIICGGSSVLARFGCVADDIEQAGYSVSRLYHEVEGNLPTTMAQSVGAGVMAFAHEFDKLKPDVCLLIGDRYEALAAATAAVMSNLCLVHLQGGERSGSVDESTRHAITKLAHYHVPATQRAKDRLLQMGEHPETILTVGCPSSDLAKAVKVEPGDYLLVVYHPTTTRTGGEREEMAEVLAALDQLKRQTVLLWPNIDAGSDGVSKAIRAFGPRPWLQTVKNLPPEKYLATLANAACAVGNSSSFIRDASFFGSPVVLIGDRQRGRECGANLWRLSFLERLALAKSIERQIEAGRYPPSDLYGDGEVSGRIVEGLKQLHLYAQKSFCDGVAVA